MHRIVALAALFTPLALPASAAPGADLVVKVVELRNLRGKVGCQVFASADGFPSEDAKAFVGTSVAASKNDVVCKFTGLAPGRYAVSVMHDEDGDGELDSNFFGVPTEGYGASNNKLPALSPPDFAASSFEVKAGETKTIQIRLKY